MKAVKINLAGRERYLSFTVEAMFQIQEQFGGPTELIETVQDSGREGFAAACRAAAIMAEQGELVRRSLGYDPAPMTNAEEIAATMSPIEAMALKMAIPAAISLGFGREIEPENDEIDLGLAELNAQKKPDDPRPLHPHGDGLRAVQTGSPVFHPRGSRGFVGALPPGPRGKTGAWSGRRIKPEGADPPAAGLLCSELQREVAFDFDSVPVCQCQVRESGGPPRTGFAGSGQQFVQ